VDKNSGQKNKNGFHLLDSPGNSEQIEIILLSRRYLRRNLHLKKMQARCEQESPFCTDNKRLKANASENSDKQNEKNAALNPLQYEDEIARL